MSVLRQAAVIGLGERGQAWVVRLLGKDWQVSGFNPQVSVAMKGAVRRGTISLSVGQAGLVIVAIPDRLALIRKVVQTVQGVAAPGCWFTRRCRWPISAVARPGHSRFFVLLAAKFRHSLTERYRFEIGKVSLKALKDNV